MDALNAVKGWIGGLTEVGLMLLALGIVAAVLIGGTSMPFFGNIVANITNIVSQLGQNGLAGLIALGIVLWLFSKRSMS
jgi:hypothetical protein